MVGLENKNNVQVRFVTKQEKNALDAAPLRIPGHIDRNGMSEIVNMLLGYEDSNQQTVHFEFLVMGNRVTSTLNKTIEALNLSLETVIEVEYLESIQPPEAIASFDVPDWIADIAVNNSSTAIAVASYDTNVHLYNLSGENVGQFTEHDSPVKAVQSIHDDSDNTEMWISGAQDGSFHIFSLDSNSNKIKHLMESKEHDGAINDISVLSCSSSQFATASQDSMIRLFDLNSSNSTSSSNINTSERLKKKRKTDNKTVSLLNSLATFEGHKESVSCVAFGSNRQLYSGSWDHTIRCWDIEHVANTNTLDCEKVVLCMDTAKNTNSNIIATGHTDNIIRLWDIKSQGGFMVKLKLKGHKGWVSSLAWSSVNPQHLCSASYDGTVRLWDVRSPTAPLHVLSATASTAQEEDKVFKILSLTWTEKLIFSGGEQKKLNIHCL